MKVQDVNDKISTGSMAKQPKTAGLGKGIESISASVIKESQQPSKEQLQASINQMSKDLKNSQVNLDFSIDKSSKEVVVKVLDSSTGEVLTQFPSKQALAISELIASQKKGAFLNKTA
jgi:flagellar protein FlaG